MTDRQERLRWGILLAILVLVGIWIGWIGYLASDDDFYYLAAREWVLHPPSAGANHWATRFPLVIPFAGLLALLGDGFAAFHVTSLGWFAALIAICGAFTASIAGARAGWIAAILVGTMPTLVTFSSIVNCDMPEAVFLIGGAWLLGIAGARARPLLTGLGAGLCFGLAMLCRETAALPLVGLVPLFLIGKPVRRDVLIACGIGFAIVMLGEMAYQGALTGDPMRRYGIAANHDSHMDRAKNLEGNFLLHPLIDPLLVLLINDDFALLFWIGIAAIAMGAWRQLHIGGQRRLAVLAVMAGADFLLVGGLTHTLVLNPRYFALAAIVVVMIVAAWLAQMEWKPRSALLLVLVGTNLLAVSIANNHPRWSADALLIAAETYPDETIIAAQADKTRIDRPRTFAGIHNIRAGVPQPGMLYLGVDDMPPANAVPLVHYPSPPTILGGMIRLVGLDGFLPAGVARRLIAPNPAATLWRISPGRSLP